MAKCFSLISFLYIDKLSVVIPTYGVIILLISRGRNERGDEFCHKIFMPLI